MTTRRRRRALVMELGSGGGLAIPDAPTFTVVPGAEDGEIEIEITAEPASWGDLTTPGDGLGQPGRIEWWNPYEGWLTLIDPSNTGTFTFSMIPDQWGETIEIRVRGVSDAEVLGAVATDTVDVAGTPFAYELVTVDSVVVTVDGMHVYVR